MIYLQLLHLIVNRFDPHSLVLVTALWNVIHDNRHFFVHLVPKFGAPSRNLSIRPSATAVCLTIMQVYAIVLPPAPFLARLMKLSMQEALRKRCLDFFPNPVTRRAVSSWEVLKRVLSSCGVLFSIGITSAALTAIQTPKWQAVETSRARTFSACNKISLSYIVHMQVLV